MWRRCGARYACWSEAKSIVCDLTVEVELEGQPVYTTECKHPVQMPYLAHFESGQAYFAVRVDPDDHAIVQSAQPLGFQKDGKDVWGIVLNAVADGEEPVQVRVGIGVPPEAVALLFPGADLPAKRRTDVADGVCIDWDDALGGRG